MNLTDDHELGNELADAFDDLIDGVSARPGLAADARRLARRRMRTQALGAGVPVLVAAGAVTALAVNTGGVVHRGSPARAGGPAGISASTGGATVHARDTAYVVRHARAELAQATHADVIRTTFSSGSPSSTGWMYVDPRTGVQYQRDLTVSSRGAPLVENITIATPIDNVLHFHNIGIDYGDHTYSEASSVAAEPMQKLSGPAPLNITSAPVDVQRSLAHGDVRETGRSTIDGQGAIALDLTPPRHPGATVTLYVDARDYQPLRLVDAPSTGPAMIEDWLPASQANINLTTGQIPAGFTRTAASSTAN